MRRKIIVKKKYVRMHLLMPKLIQNVQYSFPPVKKVVVVLKDVLIIIML